MLHLLAISGAILFGVITLVGMLVILLSLGAFLYGLEVHLTLHWSYFLSVFLFILSVIYCFHSGG